MKKSAKLIFFGTESFSAPTLQKLIAAGYDVVAVVTKPDSPSGRGQKLTAPKVKEIALEHTIKVLQPQKLSEITAEIAALQPSHGILVAYGKIIPQSTIDLFPGGIINVHPSLLPKYRGAAPIENAILNGDKETGISLMLLSSGMDEGPVFHQERLVLSGKEDRASLYGELAQKGADLVVAKLPAIIDGELKPQPQVDSLASYTKLLKKDDGLMDFSNKTAVALEHEVRAYLGFPRSRAKIGRNDVIITRVRVAKDENDGDLVLKAKDGYLEIEELIAPSGRKMGGSDFTRGYGQN